jgi:uncharacterized protein YkwD
MTSALERAIVAVVNAARRQHGRSALGEDKLLADVARAYSERMSEQGFFSHHA